MSQLRDRQAQSLSRDSFVLYILSVLPPKCDQSLPHVNLNANTPKGMRLGKAKITITKDSQIYSFPLSLPEERALLVVCQSQE
jgi:hypothetical protein